MCAFILQTLSGDRDFGVKLNKVFENHGSLPGNVRIHAFHGTYADYMISVSSIITILCILRFLNLILYFITFLVYICSYSNYARNVTFTISRIYINYY